MLQQEELITTATQPMDGFLTPEPSPAPSDAAVRLLEIATRSADELLSEANAEAAALVATAHAEADQIAAAAQHEADRLSSSASAEADQLVAAAHAEVERVHAQLEQQRTELAAEISRLERVEQGHRDLMRSHLTELLAQIDPEPED